MKVSFFPVAEHYAFAAEEVQKRKGVTQGRWVKIFTYYCIFHIILVPAILLYYDNYVPAAVSFGVTMILALVYAKLVGTNAYVDFYRQWLEKDPEEVQVELLEAGVHTSCDVCASLYKWESIYETHTTDDAIYFFTKDCGIVIPKKAFESHEHLTNFTEFANSKTSRK